MCICFTVANQLYFPLIVAVVLCAGGEIASTFDAPEKLKLGSCKLIEEIMIGEDKLIHFSGVQMGEACTIVLRGASKLLQPTDLLCQVLPEVQQQSGWYI